MSITERPINERIDPCKNVIIECGNKRLTLGINTITGEANELIMDIPGLPNIAGSTTQAHREARDIMQATANELGISIRYEFSTFPSFSQKMAQWALDPEKGRAIFERDIVRKPCFLFPLLTAIKTFYPQEAAT